jgi:hypothetical protein
MALMKRSYIAVAVILGASAAIVLARWTLVHPESPPAATQPAIAGKVFDHSAFDQILEANVRDGLVDYANIKANWMPRLAAYLDALAKQRTDDLSRDEQIALYINLYNATAICEVCKRYHPGFTVAENNFAFFKTPIVRTDGDLVSLTDLENRMIRPWYREAGIHAALVWAAKSSPPLMDRAYVGKDLRIVLDDQMWEFINDPDKNPPSPKRREIGLSQLFEWYGDDFGNAAKVLDYVNRYHEINLAGFKFYFVLFDWSLNEAR